MVLSVLLAITCGGLLLLYLTWPDQRFLKRTLSPLWQLPGWTLMLLSLGLWAIAFGMIPGVMSYTAVIVLTGGVLSLLSQRRPAPVRWRRRRSPRGERS